MDDNDRVNPCCRDNAAALKASEAKRQRLRNNLVKLKAKVIDTNSLIQLYTESQQKLQSANTQVSQLTQTINPLKAKVHSLSVQLKSALESGTDLRQELSESKAAVAGADLRISALNDELASIKVYNTQLSNDLGSVPSVTRHAKLEKDNARLTRELETKEMQVKASSKAQGALKVQVTKLSKQVAELQSQLKDAKASQKAAVRSKESKGASGHEDTVTTSQGVAKAVSSGGRGGDSVKARKRKGAPMESTPIVSADTNSSASKRAKNLGATSSAIATHTTTTTPTSITTYGSLRAPKTKDTLASYLTSVLPKLTSATAVQDLVRALNGPHQLTSPLSTKGNGQLTSGEDVERVPYAVGDVIISALEGAVNGDTIGRMSQLDTERVLALVIVALTNHIDYHDTVTDILARLRDLALNHTLIAVQRAVSACRILTLFLTSSATDTRTAVDDVFGGRAHVYILLAHILVSIRDPAAQLVRLRAVCSACPTILSKEGGEDGVVLRESLCLAIAAQIHATTSLTGSTADMARGCAAVMRHVCRDDPSAGNALASLGATLALSPEEFAQVASTTVAALISGLTADTSALRLLSIRVLCLSFGYEWSYNTAYVAHLHPHLQTATDPEETALLIEATGVVLEAGMVLSGDKTSMVFDNGLSYLRAKLLEILQVRDARYPPATQASAASALTAVYRRIHHRDGGKVFKRVHDVARKLRDEITSWYTSLTPLARQGVSPRLQSFMQAGLATP